jgi:uncharacterized protein
MMKNRSRIAIPIKCIGVIVSAVFMSSANAASFDCAKAASFSEKAVCSDPTLSSLDDTLGARYTQAYAVTPDKRALAAVRDHEWRWRQTHCRDKACVADWYERRIAELSADIDPKAPLEPAVSVVTPSVSALAAAKPTQKPPVAPSAQTLIVNVHPGAHSETVSRAPAPPPVHAVTLAPPSNGPLPPGFNDQDGSVVFGETLKSINDPKTTDILPLPPGNWAAAPAVLSQAEKPAAAGYRLFNKGERTSARTVGIFVGF